MNNAGDSIDGHLFSAWRVLYKRVYPRLKAGDAIDASIPMHGEGCMPQATALRMCLRVPVRNEWTEWTEWISAPHDCDMCPSNVREEPIDGLSLDEAKSELVNGISWGTLQGLRSLWTRTVQTIVSVWHLTGSASLPSGVFPDPRGGEAAVSLSLPRWYAMRNQEPGPSGPWSGSAYWTQVSEPVLLRASPVCPCIPGPAKRRLGLRELG